MKIILTQTEANDIARASMVERYPEGTSVDIERDSADMPSFPFGAMKEAAHALRYKQDQKIAAIKAVRTIAHNAGIHIGLVEAKNFVESI